MKPCAALLLSLLLSGSAGAQQWFVSQSLGKVRVTGLLDLPDVTMNYSDDACPSTESVAIRLFGAPSSRGASIGIVYKRNHPEYGCTLLLKRAGASTEENLPTDESGYEIAAAVVYERRERWFRIAIPGGSAWLERANDDDFLTYPLLLSDHLAYLRKDWDGRLRQNPGSDLPALDLPADWKKHIPEQIGVEILGVRRVGGDDWIQVRFEIERCGDDRLKNLKPMQGWVPAYRPDGTTSAWFYSRGC